ncbi:glycosyl hydrolase family 18 protein [Paenibacillus sp. CC-CFT747]|nr:glycosyl hydrolase family 18 protein [Paenibacillus sp. CC-CFT747]
MTAAKAVDTTKIGPMPGLNVISPQWFHLLDGEGNLQNLADPAYLKWAHDRGYQVWALFSNGFEPKRTAEALSTYDRRMKMIKQLLAYAEMYSLQGINIDFENIYLKEKENLVQFVREMVPLLHEQNLVVSIDVAVKDGSEMYSRFMDRRAVGEVVDYMMVMTYDEHWATSPKAGSVASLPWVEKGIVQIIKEDAVPPSKLLLGMPFYTRVWTEQPKDGKTAVTSKAVSMEAVQKIIEEKKLTPAWDEEAGQNYVQYTEDDKTVKIWIEDAVSVKSRVDLAKKLDLAGVASWSRAFETPDIWTVIQETLEKRP